MRRETLRRSTRGARALSLALALGLTAACKEVKPAAPNIAAVEPPDPPLSMIQAPITVPVAALRNVADQQVPRQLHTDPYLHLIDGGPDVPHCSLGVGYDISRDPLTMSGSGATLRTGLHVRYWLDARKRLPCPGPLVSGSCGTNGEAAREVNAGFNTRLGIGADWNAIVSTSADAPVPLNSCNVSFLGIDVTDKVMSFFGNKLNEMANRLNQQATTDLKLRDRALAAWQQLQQPIKLADDTWLSVAPQDIGYFPINASSTAISLGLQLTARPRVVLSAAQPTTPPRELPAARSLPAGRAFNISLPIDIGYEPINRQLRTLLSLDSGGTTFPPAGSRKVTITGAEVYAYGRQAVVRLTFK